MMDDFTKGIVSQVHPVTLTTSVMNIKLHRGLARLSVRRSACAMMVVLCRYAGRWIVVKCLESLARYCTAFERYTATLAER